MAYKENPTFGALEESALGLGTSLRKPVKITGVPTYTELMSAIKQRQQPLQPSIQTQMVDLGVGKKLTPSPTIPSPQGERYFTPTQDVKIRDVIREVPGAIGGMLGFLKRIGGGLFDFEKENIPGAGTLLETGTLGKLILIDKKIKNNTVSDEEKRWISDYWQAQEEEAEKMKDTAYRVGAGFRNSMTWMAEFGLAALLAGPSGGTSMYGFIGSKVAKKTLKEVAQKLVKDKVVKSVLIDIGKKNLKNVAKSTVMLAGLHTPQGALERIVGTPMFEENGEFIKLAEDGQSVGRAILNSVTGNIVEAASERAGEVFSLFPLLGKPIKNSLIKAGILSATVKLNKHIPPNKIANVFRMAGWNGVFNEYMEERTADVLHGALEMAGLGDQKFKLPTLKQSAEEIALFSLMGTAFHVTSKIYDKIVIKQEANSTDVELKKLAKDIKETGIEITKKEFPDVSKEVIQIRRNQVKENDNISIQTKDNFGNIIQSETGKVIKIVKNKEGYTETGTKVPGKLAGENVQFHLQTENGVVRVNTNIDQVLGGRLSINQVSEGTAKNIKEFPEELTKTTKAIPDREEIFIRLATKAEKKGGVAKSRGYNTIPDKIGYEKVYKEYGEEGAGYYYSKDIPQLAKGIKETPEIAPAEGEVPEKFKYGAQTEVMKEKLNELFGDVTKANLQTSYKGGLGTYDIEKDIITLLEVKGEVSETVAYHEAFHRVVNLFMSKAQATELKMWIIKNKHNEIEKLRDQFPKLRGYSEMEVAEEVLSNEFSRYMRTGQTWTAKISAFFDRLLQKLEFVRDNADLMQGYFESIKNKGLIEAPKYDRLVGAVSGVKSFPEYDNKNIGELTARKKQLENIIEDAEGITINEEMELREVKKRISELGVSGEVVVPESPETEILENRYYQMYSPNIDIATTFEQATKNLDSTRHANIRNIAKDINKEHKLNGTIKNVIGDTKIYGTENALIDEGTIIDSPINRSSLRVSGAKKGLIANQISTLNFIEDINGKDNFYIISHDESNVKLRKILDNNGIEFRTLDNGRFLVYDEGKVIINKIKNVNEQINGKLEIITGEGEFIGGETRAEGLQSYKRIIEEGSPSILDNGLPTREETRAEGLQPYRRIIEGSKIFSDSRVSKTKIEPAKTEEISDAGFIVSKKAIPEVPRVAQVVKESEAKKKAIKAIEKFKIIKPDNIKAGNLISIMSENIDEKGRVESTKKFKDKIFVSLENKEEPIEINPKDESLVVYQETEKRPPSLIELGLKEKPVDITKAEDLLLKSQLRAQARTARKAVAKTRKETRESILKDIKEKKETVKSIKDKIFEYAKELPISLRGKLLGKMKNVDTHKGLEEEVAPLVGRLKESYSRKKVIEEINKILDRAEYKKQSGKRVDKRYDIEAQRALHKLRKASKLTKEEGQELIDNNIKIYEVTEKDGTMPAHKVLENLAITMASGLKKMSLPELTALRDIIFNIEKEGAVSGALKKFNRQGEEMAQKGTAIETILGTRKLDPGIEVSGAKFKHGKIIKFSRSLSLLKTKEGRSEIKNASSSQLMRLFDNIIGWVDVLDAASYNDKSSKAGDSYLSRELNLVEAEGNYKEGLFLQNKRFSDDYKESYGLKSNRALDKKMGEDAEVVNLGTFETEIDGEKVMVPLEFSKSEARYMWMVQQDPSLEKTFTDGMHYTKEMFDAIDNFLGEKTDKVFCRKQLKMYKDYYYRINPVYEEINGVSLSFNDFFIRIRKGGLDKNHQDTFNDNLRLRGNLSKGSFNVRVPNTQLIKTSSDIAVMQTHIAEMEHFITYATKVRDINTIFGDAKVRAAIVQELGPSFLTLIDNFRTDIAMTGKENAFILNGWDKFRSRFVTGVLAGRPTIAVKQLVSFFAMAESIPVRDFMKGLYDFSKDPMGNFKFLKEHSKFLRYRGENIERDIRTANQANAFSGIGRFINLSMINVRFGDKIPIVVGGWAVYKYNYKQAIKDGHSEAEAIKMGISKFEKVSSETQQSAAVADQSVWQRGGPLAKLFTTFMSSPNLYFRKVLGAFRNLIAGRMPPAQAAKIFVIYWWILPTVFQLVSDFGRWDDKEQTRARILGPFNGLFIVGDMMDYILRETMRLDIFNKPGEERIARFGQNEIYQTVARDIVKVIKSSSDVLADPNAEDFITAVKDLSTISSKVTGMPIRYGFDITRGVTDSINGEYAKGFGEMLGWSEFIVKKKATEAKKKQMQKRREAAKSTTGKLDLSGIKLNATDLSNLELPNSGKLDLSGIKLTDVDLSNLEL